MLRVTLHDAENRLAELIDLVQAGESINITRRGKIVARLTLPDHDDGAVARARDAISRLRVSRAGLTLGKLKSRDLISEGRR